MHSKWRFKGYIRMDPDRVPIARRFWTGSYASAVGSRGKPCRTVWIKNAKISLVTMATRHNHGNASAMDDQKQMSSKLMDVQILQEAKKHFFNGKRNRVCYRILIPSKPTHIDCITFVLYKSKITRFIMLCIDNYNISTARNLFLIPRAVKIFAYHVNENNISTSQITVQNQS